jgi:hypothetical protein
MTGGTLLDVRTVATRSVVERSVDAETVYVAIVHAPDGVRFASAAAGGEPDIVTGAAAVAKA